MTPTNLDADEVHVWYQMTHSADAIGARDTDLAGLSADERARCARLAFPRDRCDFAAAHALLRAHLSRYADVAPADWTFDALPGGKPFIVSTGESALAFNLSHTHGLVACAIARGGQVGVDVESVDRAVDGRRIAERFFSKVECAWLDACDARERALRFIELWTLKEAYVKAIGRGLGHPLNAFSFTFADERRVLFSPPPDIEASAWTFALFAPSARYRMAVAVDTAPARRGSIVARSADGAIADAIRA